jgi:DNA-binding CsgD family transcriptional regulator
VTAPRSARPGRIVQPNLTLTDREREMLRCLADGMKRQEICGELWIALSTLKFHMRNMKRKMGARTQAHAVAIGFREGWLT